MTLSFCDLDWVHKILESFEKKNILVPKQWTLYMMNLTQLDTGGHKLILGFSWSTDKTGVLSLGTSKETSPWIPTIQFTSSQTGGLGPRLDLIHSMIRNAMWKVWLWEPTMGLRIHFNHWRPISTCKDATYVASRSRLLPEVSRNRLVQWDNVWFPIL